MANALSGSPVSYRRNALGDYRAQGNGRSPMSAVNALQALSMIPGVGDFLGPVADAAMYYDKPETRTPGNFALSTLGLLPFVPGMTVFHGSPHKFDAFDISKIGTGEGAQAYGHGLYLAENPDVAGSYKNILGGREFEAKGRKFYTSSGMSSKVLDQQSRGTTIAADALDDAFNAQSTAPAQFAARRLREQARYYPEEKEHIDEALNIIADWQESGMANKLQGNLYTVDLPDEAIDRMLDWDKPLSEQPESIRNALSLAVERDGLGGRGLLERIKSPRSDITGRELHEQLKELLASNRGLIPKWAQREAAQPDVSDWLRKVGIPGIKYLDQGSRASGQGTRNFVVFDDKLAKILKRE